MKRRKSYRKVCKICGRSFISSKYSVCEYCRNEGKQITLNEVFGEKNGEMQ